MMRVRIYVSICNLIPITVILESARRTSLYVLHLWSVNPARISDFVDKYDPN